MMSKSLPYVSTPQDLVTTREARRDGFLAIALRRDLESTPYIDQAKALWAKLNAMTKCCEDILNLEDLRPVFLLAAGYSVKAQGNMDDDDKVRLLEEFVKQVLGPVSRKYVDEIVYRYLLADQKNYVIMGELKGGIDPAGADEHWKTARAALDRIRATFKKVYIAFVGASIEKAMAEEIFTQLKSGLLDYAANLTNDNQLSDFCDWLVNQ